MRKFEKAINSRIFYETVFSDFKDNLKSIDPISIKTAAEFYEKLIVIFDENDDVVLEEHQDAQFNRALIDKIFNAQNFTQISANEIFSRCSKSIRTNYSICRDIPLYIFDFSFSKNAKFICSIFSSFNIRFSKLNCSLKEQYDFETELFKNTYENSSGLCSDLGSCVLALFNSDKKTKTTVVHELYHYLQLTLKKERSSIERSKFNNIKELQLSVDDLEYLFDSYEFETHIKVDLCNQLDEMYWKFYNDVSKAEFIRHFIAKIKENPKNTVSLFFNKLENMKNDDTTALRLFAACFLVEDKQYLLDAMTWLKASFNALS